MGFRAVLALAAAVLPRAAALRPRIRGGILPRRRVQDTCPVDDCCPAKLEPIPSAECPPHSGDVARFSCDAPDLVEGNLCRSNAGECGTPRRPRPTRRRTTSSGRRPASPAPARRRRPTSPRRPTGTWTATRTRTWAAASLCTRPCSRSVSLFAQRRVPPPLLRAC